ncbi:MAG TPA: universal stress protein [Stellaceae bacterium]|nr:universal stress protein [Stellaceae bacterium]
MSYKDLLVHVDPSRHCKTRIEAAAKLAGRLKAHLTAVYVAPELGISPFLADQFPPDLMNEVAAKATEQEETAQKLFESAARAAGVEFDWLEESGDPLERVAAHARHFDLTVLGQNDPSEVKTAVPSNLPEHVALHAGRPVLVVPFAGDFASFGERALIAWNGSAPSARALNDALPLLARAKSVTVLTIEGKHGGANDGDAEDVALHLKRHGIAAETSRIVAEGIDVGDLLLARITDVAADLLVMGAYGHSRLRERVLGGVSRELFQHMTVPVLVSH